MSLAPVEEPSLFDSRQDLINGSNKKHESIPMTQPSPPQQQQQQQQHQPPPVPPNAQQSPAPVHGIAARHRVPQFMARPPIIPGVPVGLEYLTLVDQLLVHQQVEIFEVLTGIETCNRYQVKNSVGQQVYFAGEESDSCMRQCCGPQRSFVMHITDNFGQEVIRIRRNFKCVFGCNCCAGISSCAMEISVEAPIGQTIGYVRQRRSCMQPIYGVEDAQGQTVLMIHGPSCICPGPCDTGDQEFIISSAHGGQEIGKISKQWSGFLQEYFTDADNFGITFPMDLDVHIKACLLGAVFLIDFMYYESNEAGNVET